MTFKQKGGACFVYGAMALLVVVRIGTAEIPDPPVPEDPVLLFRASFDNEIDLADVAWGDANFAPCIFDRSQLELSKNLTQWQWAKDYNTYRAKQEPAGRQNACLAVPLDNMSDPVRSHGHRFRALGNFPLRRGTVSFWIKFGRELGDAQEPVLLVENTPFFVRVRHKSVCVTDEITLDDIRWQVGAWYHVAIVYDCYQGVKVYVNGALARRSRWGKPEYGWQTDACPVDLLGLAAGLYWNSSSPLMFDELEIYSVPLAAEEIERLAQCRPISAKPTPEQKVDAETFRKERVGMVRAN